MEIEEQRKKSFGAIAKNYERFRPGYPQGCIDVLENQYGLADNKKLLEIGCGTGQLTRLLMAKNMQIDAIDISSSMLEVAQEKLGKKQVRWLETSFENLNLVGKKYDAILSATAFHWVTPEAQEHKTAQALKSGGILCFMYNHNDYADTKDPVRMAIQNVYNKVVPTNGTKPDMLGKTQQAAERFLNSPLYRKGEQYSFENPVTYTTEEYLGNFGTHSYQNTLPAQQKKALFHGIEEVLNKAGGHVTIPYKVIMWCFQRV